MKFLLPLMLMLIGSGAGIGTGLMLQAGPPETAPKHGATGVKHTDAHVGGADSHNAKSALKYVELNNQFVVPIVSGDLVESLAVMSLGIEVDEDKVEAVYQREPKLRDALLQVMFDHANIGGFRGRFTDGGNMDVLRAALTEAAQSVIGEAVTGVVITDIARQDV